LLRQRPLLGARLVARARPRSSATAAREGATLCPLPRLSPSAGYLRLNLEALARLGALAPFTTSVLTVPPSSPPGAFPVCHGLGTSYLPSDFATRRHAPSIAPRQPPQFSMTLAVGPVNVFAREACRGLGVRWVARPVSGAHGRLGQAVVAEPGALSSTPDLVSADPPRIDLAPSSGGSRSEPVGSTDGEPDPYKLPT
jgi:hypothetical protein